MNTKNSIINVGAGFARPMIVARPVIIAAMYAVLCIGIVGACSDDKGAGAGNPVINLKSTFSGAHFADSLPFTIEASDAEVPLSTLKVRLYYGEEQVAETVIRTQTNGEYSGKIYVPFYANTPNSAATLKLVLQNISKTITEQEIDLPLTRPDFPSLTFVAADEQEYTMARTGSYQYAATATFPAAETPGYIKAAAFGDNGNALTWGWDGSAVALGSTANIPFSDLLPAHTITFNTLTFEAAPFIEPHPTINGQPLTVVDDDHYTIDLDLTQGQDIVVENINSFSAWWIDPDWFTNNAGNLTFNAVTGEYRITADYERKFLRVEVLDGGGNLATTQTDGTGAIWVMGMDIDKPLWMSSGLEWSSSDRWALPKLCLAPITDKIHQISFVAGSSAGINWDWFEFAFYHQKGAAGTQFTDATLSLTPTTFVEIKSGGNVARKTNLSPGKTYVFKIDATAGISNAVLTVTEQ
jgi:hypothetical protein